MELEWCFDPLLFGKRGSKLEMSSSEQGRKELPFLAVECQTENCTCRHAEFSILPLAMFAQLFTAKLCTICAHMFPTSTDLEMAEQS